VIGRTLIRPPTHSRNFLASTTVRSVSWVSCTYIHAGSSKHDDDDLQFNHRRKGLIKMADVRDVARYILRKHAPISAMKLQKLVYYAQGWHLAYEGEPLFESRIEAWANGPVVRELYNAHRGLFQLHANTFGRCDEGSLTGSLTSDEIETIDAVLDAYGDMDAHQLSNLTHSELPWIEARRGMASGERGNTEIDTATMMEFFDKLLIPTSS
jgi:uncharacterized phage-associated protein